MSADLLRRAAARLRESALAAGNVAPGGWFEAPSDPRPNRVIVADGQVTPVATVHENCELPHLSGYLTLVHPPVALALADLLERAAYDPNQVDNDLWAEFEHTAWQVLREPEGGDRT